MSISPHEEKMLNLQHQMRQNQSELQSYLAGLDDWTSEIKEKENRLKSSDTGSKTENLPPVRNTIEKKKLKKRKKEKKVDPNKPKKISGFDFRAWDKFDVDKALEEIDEQEQKKETSSSEYETDEEWEIERKKHLADVEKDKGNKFLKNGDLDRAVEAYTKGMELDATNSILPANRALALIKQQKYGAAEIDCTTSIVLDPLYVKAYLRRATARASVGRTQDAISDYRRVLDLEPANKQAKADLERMEKELSREKEGPVKSSFVEGSSGVVKPVYKSPEDRSKVPMKRIVIEEIGVEVASRPQRPSAAQSEVAQKITAKEGEAFDSLFSSAPSTAPSSSPAKDQPSQKPAGSDRKTAPASSDKQNNGVKPNGTSERVHPQEKKANITEVPLRENQENKTNTTEVPLRENISESNQSSHQTVLANTTRKGGRVSSESTTQSEPGALNGAAGDGRDFQVPQSSFQFQADFRLLKRKPEAFSRYFQAISPSQYPKLFGQCLDADILMAILKSLSLWESTSQEGLYDVLHNLTLVKRFSMTAMFLSGKDKKVVEDLINRISGSGRPTDKELKSLSEAYQL